VMAMPSLVGDGVAKSILVVASCHYRVLLAMALPRRHWSWHCRGDTGHGVMSLPMTMLT
jgi:hypothetical protein